MATRTTPSSLREERLVLRERVFAGLLAMGFQQSSLEPAFRLHIDLPIDRVHVYVGDGVLNAKFVNPFLGFAAVTAAAPGRHPVDLFSGEWSTVLWTENGGRVASDYCDLALRDLRNIVQAPAPPHWLGELDDLSIVRCRSVFPGIDAAILLADRRCEKLRLAAATGTIAWERLCLSALLLRYFRDLVYVHGYSPRQARAKTAIKFRTERQARGLEDLLPETTFMLPIRAFAEALTKAARGKRGQRSKTHRVPPARPDHPGSS